MNLHELVGRIDDALLCEGNEPVLTRTVKWFSEHENLKDLIDTCLSERLDDVVSNSFLHPNGFDKFVLLSGKHFNLRLHNFHPPQEMKPAESVHNHKWEFASSIVAGEYTASDYNVDEGADLRKHYKYSKEDGLTYQGQQGVQPINEYQVVAGDTYFMSGDNYHSIKQIGPKGCITVMMTGYTKETTTNVYSLTELDIEQTHTSCGLRMYSAKEIKATLENIKEKI